MKKLYVTLCLLFGIGMAYGADTALTLDGKGTAGEPYLIKTAADLMQLANACNSGTSATTASHYAGVYFRQISDIDMSGVENFYGIATAPLAQSTATNKWSFQGIYDGSGYRIKNMTIKGLLYKDDGSVNTSTTANGSRRYVGLFGVLDKNAKVTNVIIDASCSVNAYAYAGGVVGYSNTGCVVENCINYATVYTHDDYAGGIVGYSNTDSKVSNCANYGNITASDDYLGGVVGCFNTTSTKTGGVYNCFNAGKIEGCGTYAGGIAGRSSYGDVDNCANVGMVKCYQFNTINSAFSQKNVGGIVGDANYAKVSNCFNAGDVYAMKETAGGIAGVASQNTTKGGVLSCVNVGYVYAAQEYLAGVIYGNRNSTSAVVKPQNCYYDAQIHNSLFGANSVETDTVAEVHGYTTAQLTSGQTLPGLTGWVYRAGSYPVPANLNYTELTAAAATYPVFPAGQDANLLTGTVTMTANTTVEILPNEVPGSAKLFTVANNAITAHPTQGNGVAVFKITNGAFSRHFIISTYSIPFNGNGTAASPYLINTPSDLQHLADLTSNMRLHWEGKHFNLTSDLDCSSLTDFKGIGCHLDTVNNFAPSFRLHFDGVFDGQNHKISNLTINHILRDADGVFQEWRKGTIYSGGLFGTLKGAEIRNLVIDNTCKYETYMYSGGLASMVRLKKTKIDNVHVAAQINAYNRYVGGILGEDNTDGPVEITNCSFSGKIHGNWDYVGGIISFNQNEKTQIIGCVNAGSIDVENFDTKAASNTSQVNRIGGISGATRGLMIGCASYGPINFTTLANGKSQAIGIGGLTGQASSLGDIGAMRYNVTSSQVYVNGPTSPTGKYQVGAMIGDTYYGSKYKAFQFNANYADTTLCAHTVLNGNVSYATGTLLADSIVPTCLYGKTTQELTSGVAIDSLAQHFTFENGYYPMPKALANRPEVRAAAATFMKIPVGGGGNILTLAPGAICPFNDVVKLTGSLKDGKVFYIKDNALRMHRSEAVCDDVLTLVNGNYSTFYPLHKLVGMGVSGVDNDAEVILSTEYYTPQGLRVNNPAKGTLVIAVSKTLSGKLIVTRQVVR